MSKKKTVKKYSKEELALKKALQKKKTIITLSIVSLLIFGWVIFAVWDDATHSTRSKEATEIVTTSIDQYLSDLVSQ